MLRSVFFVLFLSIPFLSVSAQNLDVTTSTYYKNTVDASVTENGMIVSEGNNTILEAEYNFPAEPDPSLKAYAMPNGSVVVRENIANFLFYDSFGNIRKSISNSSQSEGGEAISEFAVDVNGKTKVIYNPKIIRDGKTGSRAKFVQANMEVTDVFSSQDRAIQSVDISTNGELIAITTMKEGTDDEVTILDQFGNILATIEFDQDVKGVTFSENGLFATIYSGGRAAAYEISSKERVGSTSFRNTSVIYANYSPEDKTIIALTGKGEQSYSELQAHTVNVSARKIARKDINGTMKQLHQIVMERTGNGRYLLLGLDSMINLRAQF